MKNNIAAKAAFLTKEGSKIHETNRIYEKTFNIAKRI